MHIREAMKLLGLVAALVVLILVVIQSEQAWVAQTDCTIIVQLGQSIQQAIDQAEQGAVVCLSPGTFQENIGIKKSLTLRGAGQEQTTIKSKTAGQPVVGIESAAAIEVSVEGLTIAEAKQIFDYDVFIGIGTGIWVGGHVKVTIRTSQLSGNQGGGLSVGGSARVSLAYSTVSGNGGDGLSVGDSARVSLAYSTVSGNGGDGLLVWGSARVSLAGSQISGNGSDGLLVGSLGPVVEIQNSWISDNASCGISGAPRVLGRNNWIRNNVRDICHFTAPEGFLRSEPPRPLLDVAEVCPQGCPFSEVGQAIWAVRPGGVVRVGAGIYREGMLLVKDLTVEGASPEKTILIGSFNDNGVTIVGSARVNLQGLQVSGQKGFGFHVSGSGGVILTNIQASNNREAGLWVTGSGGVILTNIHVSNNGSSGLWVTGSGRVILTNIHVSNNGSSGLWVTGSGSMEIRQSFIEGNGTSPDCARIIFCNGIELRQEDPALAQVIQVTIINSIIQNNAGWGVGAGLKQCGDSWDNFTGKVKFQGTNVIKGNNKSGNHNKQGNPGNHPFKNLPDGQVCLP